MARLSITNTNPVMAATSLSLLQIRNEVWSMGHLMASACPHEIAGLKPSALSQMGQWMIDLPENYYWGYRYFEALCSEYQRRVGKAHKYASYLPQLAKDMTITDDAPDWSSKNSPNQVYGMADRYATPLYPKRRWY